jgi:hypothetical protein
MEEPDEIDNITRKHAPSVDKLGSKVDRMEMKL